MKKFNICKEYGLIWHGFRVKKGVAFGYNEIQTPEGAKRKLWVCPSVSSDSDIADRLPMYRQKNDGTWYLKYEKSHTTRFIINLVRRDNLVIDSARHYSNPYDKRTMQSIQPSRRTPQRYIYNASSIRAVDHGQQSQSTLATLGQDDFFGMDGYNGWAGYH